MITLTVNNFAEWRTVAKQHILLNASPQEIIWDGEYQAQTNLLTSCHSGPRLKHTGVNSGGNPFIATIRPASNFTVPKAFLELAEKVSCHRDPNKWDKLYRALWRITHGEKNLLAIKSDPLIHELFLKYKAVRRDMHKMKAFVRFKLHVENQTEYYIAWYKPDHNILRMVAPFFKRRFSVMQWTIMTPHESVSWDSEKLIYSPGIRTKIENIDDQLENLWCTYYRAIFNPARIKIKAMKNEMPVRFWNNLPEAALIPQILSEAPARVAKMMQEQEGLRVSAKNYFPKHLSLDSLAKAAAQCEGCPIYKCARQTVFGTGNHSANLMIVGEQPGLQEDLAGEPFVGPAGKVLRHELNELAIQPKEIYLTNAVKHFKNIKIDGRQMHRSPDIKEVNACKPWLLAEIELVKPKVILCLGVTPSKALINPGFKMTTLHGKWQPYDETKTVIAGTYHPSALLRAPTPEAKESMLKVFKEDLQKAFELASGSG